MTKKNATTAYVCNECGQDYAKWLGRCDSCGAWNTVVEMRIPATRSSASGTRSRGAAALAAATEVVSMGACTSEKYAFVSSGYAEIDRVLGGGVAPGALILLGGDPGIGKSTLLLQLMAQWARRSQRVLYVSGEESLEQIAQRAKRLGADAPEILLLAETSADAVVAHLETVKPSIVVIDSIQTMYLSGLESAAGSVSQIRESAAELARFAKKNNTAIFLIGHVTKEGAIAGPRVLEHMVDTVLYFEGDSNYQYRIIRSVKNRFGPSGEIAIFTMTDRGLSEVTNPSELFLHDRAVPQTGSAIVPVLEGSRVLVVELQALVNRSHFGLPQRVAAGINPKKLSLLLAVLERYGGIALGDHDVFFNITGGLTVAEPAVDLAAAAAVYSSYRNKPLRQGLALLGEVGLSGEIRAVNRMDLRLRELARLGLKECVVPLHSAKTEWRAAAQGLVLVPCGRIAELGDKVL